MSAEVTFNFAPETDEEILIVPSVAVAEDLTGNYVFVAQKIAQDTSVVLKRYIQIGDLINENFEVVDGLEEGEAVITAGISKLSEGMKVKLLK